MKNVTHKHCCEQPSEDEEQSTSINNDVMVKP